MNQTYVAMNECVWLQTRRGQGKAAGARCRCFVCVWGGCMATAAGPAPVSRERLRTNGPVFHTHAVCNAGYDSKPRF